MKKFNKLIGFIVVFMVMMATMCSVSFAATVGKALTSPEGGWQRIDNTNSNIKYTGTWFDNNGPSEYKGTGKASGGSGNSIKFKFYGTKFRIISCVYSNRSSGIGVEVDGISLGTYSQYGNTIWQALVYEEIGLTEGIHTVVLTNTKTGNFDLDAIDIDNTGYLVDSKLPNAPTNLTAKTYDSRVDLLWTSVSEATSYNIYRSEIYGFGYKKIGSTTTSGAVGYEDFGLTTGNTYYYVVSAVTSNGESPNSNEVSATLQATNQLKLVLEVNEAKQLSISNELGDNAEMEWTSTNSTVATVDVNGKVKALKLGNTVITCTSEDYTESINVLVVDLEYQLAVDLNVSDTCRLTVDDLVNTTKATWLAYDPTIATVSAKGKVTAIREGLTYIVASDKDGNEIGRIYIRVRN